MCDTTVKIIDPKSAYYGQELEGYLCYGDIYHTGKGPDLFYINTPNGSQSILSTSIDIEHYENQLLQQVINHLDANIGDKVIILNKNLDVDNNVQYTITDISPYGSVSFDNEKVRMYICR